MAKVAVVIGTRDRPTELALLLQSLRTQTFQNFDIFILEDQSGTSWQNYHFLNMMINRVKLENHRVTIKRTPYHYGVSKAREESVQMALKSKTYYDYLCRVDDDVILEPDFIERLIKVIEKGYDIASGVTPQFISTFKRDVDKVDIANKLIIKDGVRVYDGDDCGLEYIGEKIVPCHHFRSSALIKREVHEQVKYYPTKLTKHGFREETMFSLNAALKGFKMGVDLQAIAWHLCTPSGGERFADQQQLAQFNQEVLNDFIKTTPEFNEMYKGEVSKLERMKETNMAK